MKRCPACGRTFTNSTLINCLNDGMPLVEDTPAPAPYFGAPPPAVSAETPSAESPTAETPPDAPVTTYTNMPLAAIPELQSPEMQAALKEALDKAGMSSLFGADLSGKSTVSVTTRITTDGSEVPSAFAQTPPQGSVPLPGFAPPPASAGASPYYAGTAPPRRKRSPWVLLIIAALVVFLVISGIRYIAHQAVIGLGANTAVPADIVTAIKNADDAEIEAVSDLNPAPLYSTYAGSALARELSNLDALRAARRSQKNQLTAQKFGAFKASADGSEAQVDVTETWDTVVYAEPGHTVVSHTSGDDDLQTVTLKRTQNGWIVEKIEFHHS